MLPTSTAASGTAHQVPLQLLGRGDNRTAAVRRQAPPPRQRPEHPRRRRAVRAVQRGQRRATAAKVQTGRRGWRDAPLLPLHDRTA